MIFGVLHDAGTASPRFGPGTAADEEGFKGPIHPAEARSRIAIACASCNHCDIAMLKWG